MPERENAAGASLTDPDPSISFDRPSCADRTTAFAVHAGHREGDAAGPVTTIEMHDQVGAGPRASEPRSRTYVDDDGMSWQVSEQSSEYDRRHGRSLIFASDLAVRRVRNYPADWFSLSELALIALSWSV